MTIFRSSGKNTEVYEEYELYTKEYVENVGGKSNFTAKGGTTIGENPKTAKPLEIRNLYVKVRLAGEYKGEFGFDWVDVNPDTLEIEKIQDVPYDNVEYFYKEDPNGLGNIVEKSADLMGAKHAIQKHYEFSPISKFIDIPYVLLMPTKKAVLSAEIILWQGAINEDVVAITGDEFYEFTIIGGEKEGKTAKKKVTADEKIKFEVECLKPGAIDKTYEFKHSNPITGSPAAVGGVRMMENKVLKLKFRVIALVSSDGSPSAKAKALFQKFKNNDVTKYLNENSLNQAGYKVEIENQEMFTSLDSADVDDYLFAFDKADWASKNYYSIEERERPKLDSNGDGTQKTDGTWEMEKYNVEKVFDDAKIDTGKKDKENKPIMDTLSIDNITTDEYLKKIKAKNKSYSGGLIILVDGECKETSVGAFSRTSPLNHYSLVVYSTNTGSTDTYSHEIGHMLGLPHLFYTELEKKSYKIARENILGNGSDNAGMLKLLNDLKLKNDIYYGWRNIKAIKQDVINALLDYNVKNQTYINSQNRKKATDTAYYIRFGPNDIINYSDGTHKTKNEHFAVYDKNIEGPNNAINQNKKALLELNKNEVKNYDNIEPQMWFIRTDLIKLLQQNLDYYKEIINQTHSNYIMFKQKSTSNQMDYHNTRLRYLSNQIEIMRKDYKNY